MIDKLIKWLGGVPKEQHQRLASKYAMLCTEFTKVNAAFEMTVKLYGMQQAWEQAKSKHNCKDWVVEQNI